MVPQEFHLAAGRRHGKRKSRMEAQNVISIRADFDVTAASIAAREAARRLGFNAIDQARIATATSELARNILLHAGEGSVIISPVDHDDRRGIELIFEDEGPGMPGEYSNSSNGSGQGDNGIGLAGSRRLMDELRIDAQAGHGTRVICYKWLR
jgi:serine/threonine-protein kinase RsbT